MLSILILIFSLGFYIFSFMYIDLFIFSFTEAVSGDLQPSNLHSVDPYFTGREAECAEILQHLTEKSTRVITVVGPPGFGKTSIATAIGHQIISKSTPVFFLSLRELATVDSLAKKLLTLMNPSILASLEKTGHMSVLEQLYNYVRSVDEKLLLIFDNAEEFLESTETDARDGLLRMISELVQFNVHLRILCTSRKTLKFSNFRVDTKEIQTHELLRCKAVELTLRLAPELSAQDANALCELCGDVPLAIRLLCSTIREDHITLQEITQSSRKGLVLQLLSDPNAPEEFRFSNLLESSFQRLSQDVQRSFLMLTVFQGAFDAAAASSVLQKEAISLKKCLGELESRSLLEFDCASKRYRLHPLLHCFCLEKVEKTNITLADYAQAKKRFFRYFLSTFKSMVLSYPGLNWRNAVDSFEMDRGNIYESLTKGAHDDEIWSEVIDAITTKNAEYFLDYVLSYQEYKALHDFCLAGAKKRNDQVRRKQILVNKLLICMTLQDFEEASRLQSLILEAGGSTGKFKCYCGFSLVNNNQMEEGLRLIQDSITEASAASSEEHAIVKVLALYFLACISQKQGKHEDERKNRERADKECREHGLPTIAAKEFVQFFSSQPQGAESFEANREWLFQENMRGSSVNHPLSAQFCTILNVIPAVTDDVDGTLRALYRVLDVRERKLGSHVRTAECYCRISELLFAKCEYAASLQIRQKALQIQETVLGKQSNTAHSHHHIGLAYLGLEDYTSSVQAFYQALALQEELLGQHIDTALSYLGLGVALFSLGDTSNSLQAFKIALRMHKDFDDANAGTAFCQLAIGTVHFHEKQYPECLDAHMQELSINERLLGQHPNTAESYLNVGLVLQVLNRHQEATEAYKNAAEMVGEVFCARKAAHILLQISKRLEEMKQYDVVLETLRKAVVIQEQADGKQRDLAKSHAKIALILERLGDYQAAVEANNRSIAILQGLSCNPVELREHHKATARFLRQLGDRKGAKEAIKKRYLRK